MSNANNNSHNNNSSIIPEEASRPLTIQAQYIKDLSFENPHFLRFVTSQAAPEIGIGIDVQAQGLGNKAYEVTLNIQAKATYRQEESAQEETVFLVELAYAGICSVNVENEDEIKQILLIDCPQLLFPYARSIVTEVTKESGLMPLVLAPVDFLKLYQQQTLKQ